MHKECYVFIFKRPYGFASSYLSNIITKYIPDHTDHPTATPKSLILLDTYEIQVTLFSKYLKIIYLGLFYNVIFALYYFTYYFVPALCLVEEVEMSLILFDHIIS